MRKYDVPEIESPVYELSDGLELITIADLKAMYPSGTCMIPII